MTGKLSKSHVRASGCLGHHMTASPVLVLLNVDSAQLPPSPVIVMTRITVNNNFPSVF